MSFKVLSFGPTWLGASLCLILHPPPSLSLNHFSSHTVLCSELPSGLATSWFLSRELASPSCLVCLDLANVASSRKLYFAQAVSIFLLPLTSFLQKVQWLWSLPPAKEALEFTWLISVLNTAQ